MGERAPRGRARLVAAGVLIALYALPLFWPPGPCLPLPAPDDGTMARLFPGVPALWVVGRLAALALAAALLSDVPVSAWRDPFRRATASDRAPRTAFRLAALAVAIAQALAAPWAARLGSAGQTAYVAMLFAPAALLALERAGTRSALTPRTRRGALATAAVILVWTAARLVSDVGAWALRCSRRACCRFASRSHRSCRSSASRRRPAAWGWAARLRLRIPW